MRSCLWLWLWLCVWLCVGPQPRALASPPAQPERPRCQHERCRELDHTKDEFFYIVDGVKVMMSFAEGGYFSLNCSVPLEAEALPRFARPFTARRVRLVACAAAAGYGAALRRLNLRGVSALVLAAAPAAAPLTRRSFAGLPALRSLQLFAPLRETLRDVADDALEPLAELEDLKLVGVRVPRLPRALRRLTLKDCGLRALPADLPPSLRALTAEDSLELDAGAVRQLPELRNLTLAAPLAAWPPLGAAAERVTLWSATLRAPPPLAECAALRSLELVAGALARPPRGWLARCRNLTELHLNTVAEFSISEGMLEGAASLSSLRIVRCRLRAVPADAFRDTGALRALDLSHNELAVLEAGALVPLAGSLESLDLSYNRLTAVVAQAALPPLVGLADLNLNNNPLGDACEPTVRAPSFLARQLRLRRLALSGARLTRVCADWLRDMKRLQQLDLTNNSIEQLLLEDLTALPRLQPSTVALNKNPLRVLLATELDLRRDDVARAPAESYDTTFEMDATLECDCHAYWAWRALREGRVRARLEPRCAAGGGRLRDAPPAALRCAVPPPACPPRCRCALTPVASGPASVPQLALALRCVAPPPRAPLDALAAAASVPLRHLDLSAANLTHLPRYLPDDLQLLNLSDNRISEVSPASAAYVLRRARGVALAGNPLRCRCTLLAALRPHRARLADAAFALCAPENVTLSSALETQCGAGAGAVDAGALAGGAVLALAAAAVAGAVLRARAKRLLAAWRGTGAGPDDEFKPFDVYLSYAEVDEKRAMELARLLRGAGLCVCVRSVHWRPGAWVPAQLAASVRAARRTLALVTPRWAAGRWTRAELRLAAERRALLLLLDGGSVPAEAPRDAPRVSWRQCHDTRALRRLLPHHKHQQRQHQHHGDIETPPGYEATSDDKTSAHEAHKISRSPLDSVFTIDQYFGRNRT